MIDQAIVASNARRSDRGLKLAIVLLSGLVLVSIAMGAFLVLERSRSHESEVAVRVPSGGDPSSAGSRLAAANDAIYLLAYRRSGSARTQGFCTGFAVTRDLIATNAHCVQVANDEIARGSAIVALRNKAPGAVLPARPVYMDARFRDSRYSRGGTGYDVGLVRVTGTLPTHARLATEAELLRAARGRRGVRLRLPRDDHERALARGDDHAGPPQPGDGLSRTASRPRPRRRSSSTARRPRAARQGARSSCRAGASWASTRAASRTTSARS
ncbi:MAG: trypsin-like serine protease [Deltaproteobacteria bacterium]|nr:trypsin-like serine protease [Deltaproteobacteria bacterium]